MRKLSIIANKFLYDIIICDLYEKGGDCLSDDVKFDKSYSPYMKDKSEDMEIWFERYKKDTENTRVIKGTVFSKIISRSRLCMGDEQLLNVIFVPEAEVLIGDVLTDENGLEFTVKSIEMIRFACGEVPEWYFKAMPIIISGDVDNIGEYLRVKTANM